MGKGGGGDGGAAAAAAAAEAARRSRIASNIEAVKGQFFNKETPRVVPAGISRTVTETNPAYTQAIQDYRESQDDWGAIDDQSLIDRGYLRGIDPQRTRTYNTNQAAIDEAVAYNTNRPFTNQYTPARLASFEDIENRVRDRFLPDFEQDIGDARRELKFALSRRNLLGSSAQADAEARLMDRIGEGRRSIDQRVAGARSEKEALDQSLMNNLMAQAQSDVSRGSLLGGIGTSFMANKNRAINMANQQAMGNIFQDVGSLFKEIQDQRSIQQGMANAALFASQSRSNPYNMMMGQKGTSGSVIENEFG